MEQSESQSKFDKIRDTWRQSLARHERIQAHDPLLHSDRSTKNKAKKRAKAKRAKLARRKNR